MSTETIEQRLKKVIATNMGCDAATITSESRFAEDLNVDSLDAEEISMEAEEEFGVVISDDEVEDLATFGEAVKWLEEQLKS